MSSGRRWRSSEGSILMERGRVLRLGGLWRSIGGAIKVKLDRRNYSNYFYSFIHVCKMVSYDFLCWRKHIPLNLNVKFMSELVRWKTSHSCLCRNCEWHFITVCTFQKDVFCCRILNEAFCFVAALDIIIFIAFYALTMSCGVICVIPVLLSYLITNIGCYVKNYVNAKCKYLCFPWLCAAENVSEFRNFFLFHKNGKTYCQ